MRGSFWSFVGSSIAYATAFGASLVSAQLLGKNGFGELSMVRNTISTIGIFAGLGLGLTATKYVAEYREKDPERTSRIIQLCLFTALTAGVIVTIILAVGSPFVANKLLAAPQLTSSLLIGSLLLFVYAYDGTQKGVLAGFEAYRRTAGIYAIGGVLTFTLVVAGTWLWSVNGALVGFLTSASVILLLNNLAIRAERRSHAIPAQAGNVWAERGMLTGFSLPALFSSMVVGVAIWIVNMMLVNQPNGYAEMGIIGATNNITMFAMFVPTAALQVFLPIMAMELNKEGQARTSRRLLILNSYTAFFLTTSFVSILLYFVPAILDLYGSGFGDGKVAMVLILCSLPILTYKDGIARFIQAKAMLWTAFASNLVWASLLLSGSYLLLGFGASGVAAAILSSYFINSVIFVPIYYRRLDMQRQLWRDIQLGFFLALSIIPGAVSNFVPLNSVWLASMFLATIFLVLISLALILRWFRE